MLDDERTPEQIKADDAMDAALKSVVAAYGLAPGAATFISNYVVIGNGLASSDGGERLFYFNAFKDGGTDVNWDLYLGMVSRAKHEMIQGYFDDVAADEY